MTKALFRLCAGSIALALACPTVASVAQERQDSRSSIAGQAMPAGTARSAASGKAAGAGVAGQRATVAVPLTKAECEGLGGTVSWTLKCKNEGHQEACVTVNPFGWVRTACIDEVAD